MVKSVKFVLFALIFISLLLYLKNFIYIFRKSRKFSSKISCIDKSVSTSTLRLQKSGSDCQEILQGGDESFICNYWKTFNKKAVSDEAMYNAFMNCYEWKWARGYPLAANSAEEGQFPLAYSLSVYKNVEQIERLIRMIYWPQNLYCLHVDIKASNYTLHALERFAQCFPNIFLTKSENVYWAGYAVLKTVLNCMNDTLNKYPNHTWRYMINLSGQDFPLKTNLQIVSILNKLNGTNDVELQYETQFSRYWYVHEPIFDAQGRLITHKPKFGSFKLPVPYNLNVFKGNLAATLSRKFVEFLFNNPVALKFMAWLEGTDTPDEHLWPTINYNYLKGYGLAPGAYDASCHNFSTGDKPWISRYVKWRNEKHDCHGKYVRDVCILGIGDVPNLVLPNRTELFVNKFYIDYQTKAFQCMEHWFLEQIRRNESMTKEQLDFYANLGLKDTLCKNYAHNNMPLNYRKLFRGTVKNV